MLHNLLTTTELQVVWLIARYIIGITVPLGAIYRTIKAIKERKFLDAVIGILTIPFLLFFIFALIHGGTAFNNAAKNYEFYEIGRYYLSAQRISGPYKEVSYEIYSFMRIMEVVGITTLLIAIAIAIVNNIVSKIKNKKIKE